MAGSSGGAFVTGRDRVFCPMLAQEFEDELEALAPCIVIGLAEAAVEPLRCRIIRFRPPVASDVQGNFQGSCEGGEKRRGQSRSRVERGETSFTGIVDQVPRTSLGNLGLRGHQQYEEIEITLAERSQYRHRLHDALGFAASIRNIGAPPPSRFGVCPANSPSSR